MTASNRLLGIGLAAVLALPATAATQTYVDLAGRDDAIPKLGLPGVAIRVEAPNPADASGVRGELARELARVVHTRRLMPGEAGDYDLTVTVEPLRHDGMVATIPFEATLMSARGERVWKIEGRSVGDGPAAEPSAFTAIGRNVVSALVHDGWLTPRYDPDDPPPAAPSLRNADTAR